MIKEQEIKLYYRFAAPSSTSTSPENTNQETHPPLAKLQEVYGKEKPKTDIFAVIPPSQTK